MAGLRPIGSEKLEGMDKIRRIMEIARYNENIHQTCNEINSYLKELKIVCAKLGIGLLGNGCQVPSLKLSQLLLLVHKGCHSCTRWHKHFR